MTKARNMIATVFVAIYLRLSRDDQNGNAESMSISNQRDMLIAYCEERGWKIYDIYVEACDIIRQSQITVCLQGFQRVGSVFYITNFMFPQKSAEGDDTRRISTSIQTTDSRERIMTAQRLSG